MKHRSTPIQAPRTGRALCLVASALMFWSAVPRAGADMHAPVPVIDEDPDGVSDCIRRVELSLARPPEDLSPPGTWEHLCGLLTRWATLHRQTNSTEQGSAR